MFVLKKYRNVLLSKRCLKSSPKFPVRDLSLSEGYLYHRGVCIHVLETFLKGLCIKEVSTREMFVLECCLY